MAEVDEATRKREPLWNVDRTDILYIITEELQGFGVIITNLAAVKQRLTAIEYCYRAKVDKKKG